MTLVFRKTSRGMSSTSVTVDFNVTFGGRMESIISHKDRISELMWTWQLENSAEISGKLTVDVGFDSLAYSAGLHAFMHPPCSPYLSHLPSRVHPFNTTCIPVL